MKVVEIHEVVIFRVGEDGAVGPQKVCCDGYASDDFVSSQTTIRPPREATQAEIEAYTRNVGSEQEHVERAIKDGLLTTEEEG